MAKFGVRIITSVVAAVALGASLLTGTASATTDSYANCPYGRACLFSGTNGSGGMWYPLGCGTVDLRNYGVGDWARSYRTYGNRIRLSSYGDTVGYEYPAWSQNNFGTAQQAVFDFMTVVC
ncbi:hypothetical protein [Actinocrispum sp. NPDC049592]|uniref:peptidase inhibitor family I36 protein n=1 Tax=Actinocrispum sp. NPDC049592 TaxID=3154835 RepID=UPI00343F620F